MSSHILLELAIRKPYITPPQLPSRAAYNVKWGYWTIDGEVMVNSSVYQKRPPMSKKADQETGEDIKGE